MGPRLAAGPAFEPCPEEEGIKTWGRRRELDPAAFEPCPEEEGIKTRAAARAADTALRTLP